MRLQILLAMGGQSEPAAAGGERRHAEAMTAILLNS